MKTISLSSIAFACLCLFNSCTKESSDASSTSSLNNLSSSRAAVLGANVDNGGGNTKIDPQMTITYNPNPGVVNQPVTITGSFTGTAIPDCGKLQLQQLINNKWETVSQKEVNSTVHELTYTFNPTIVGTAAYQFQLHYVASENCKGFSEAKSGSFPLDVIEACQGLTFTGEATAAPSNNGKYLFTVTYTVNPCGLEFDKLKTQGGLTNGVDFISALGGMVNSQNWIPGSSTNKIIKWEEKNQLGVLLPTTKRVYVIKFEKAYSGSGSIELTGDWSTSVSLNGVEVAKAEVPKIYYQP